MTYVSRITSSGMMKATTLEDIAKVSKRNNMLNNITGTLCYGEGYFFQYVEGSEQALTNLKNELLMDLRHQDMKILCFEVIAERLFNGWTLQSVILENWLINSQSMLKKALPFRPDSWKKDEWQELIVLLKAYHDRQEQPQKKPLEYTTLGLALVQIVGDHRAFFVMQVILVSLILLTILLITLCLT